MTILENWSSITTIYIFKIELLQNIVEYRFSRMLFTALKYFGCCRVEKRNNMLPRRAEKIIDKEHRSSDVQHVYNTRSYEKTAIKPLLRQTYFEDEEKSWTRI